MWKSSLLRLSAIIALLLLVAFIAREQTFQANEHAGVLRATFLNIGQGDAILIDTPDHHQILTDGGRDSRVLTELQKAMGSDKEIDLVISTHDDADHLGGLNYVLQHYKVDQIWLTGAVSSTKTYQTFIIAQIQQKQIPVQKVMAGSKISFGELQGIVISPLQNYDGVKPESQNDTSIVSYWQYGQESLLLTGDAEVPAEQAMLTKGVLRHTDILKVSHHGSHTASSEAFLQAITPKIAIISVGLNNSYGHPHGEVLQRLATLAIPTLRTDHDGTIVCDLTVSDFHCSGQH